MTESADLELLPCPFCASERAGVGSSEGYDPEDGVGQFTVMCTDCGASVSLYFDTEDEAVTAWNTRSLSPTKD